MSLIRLSVPWGKTFSTYHNRSIIASISGVIAILVVNGRYYFVDNPQDGTKKKCHPYPFDFQPLVQQDILKFTMAHWYMNNKYTEEMIKVIKQHFFHYCCF